MKIKPLAIIALFISVVSQAQTTQPSEKVKQAFSSEELSKKTDVEIQYLNYVAVKGYTIVQEGKPGVTYPLLSTNLKPEFKDVKLNELTKENFNPYMVKSDRNKTESYQIDGTTMIVNIYSDDFETSRFSAQQPRHAKPTTTTK